jgi:TetR/AcrR family transcriptional regulator, tetracycline repressor protein
VVRHVAVTREQLVETSILVLDEAGLAGLTLRQVAARLGVQAPALYWHVRNKRELLDLMAEEIVARSIPADRHQPAPGQPWWEWLTERTEAICQSLRGHPDSAQVIAGNRPTWKTLPQIERLLGILVEVGFPPAEALHAVLALGNLVTGCVLEEQASANRPADAERDETMLAGLRSGRFPVLAAAADGQDPNADTFEYALRLMIAGLRGRHAELRAQAPSGAERTLTEMAGAMADELAGAAFDSVLRDLADPANLPKRSRSPDRQP